MLHFFRKFQKILFIFITVIIIISFSFFGAISSFNESVSRPPDQVIGKRLDGSHLMEREVLAITQLISASSFDRDLWQRGKAPHLLNDSVIQKDLMATGMGIMLARQYFEELKPDLEKRLARLRNFRSYVHPQDTDISAERVWERHFPKILYHLSILRNKTDQITLETLAILFELYLDQVILPSDVLKQILINQQHHLSVEPDPILINGDLSLFGFHSLEDWFGPKFVQLAGQFILHAAAVAKENGYQVSHKQVRADLFQNIYQGYSQISRQTTLSSEEADQYYRLEMQHLAMDEQSLLNTWREVMLFRNMFNDVGNSVVLDAALFEHCQISRKEEYEFSPCLQFQKLEDLFKLQIYLQGISHRHAQFPSELSLPLEVDSIAEIEERAPFLVERRCEVQYAQVTQEDLFAEISIKQTWDWEAAPKNWGLLVRQFPTVLKGKVESGEERLALLDKVPSKERLKIDQFARAQMLGEHPEKIAAALDHANVHIVSLGLRTQGGVISFIQKEDRALVDLLEQAPMRGESLSLQNEKIQNQLNLYSADGKTFYRISVLQRDPEKSVLTYEKALNDGTLENLLNERLENAYPNVRKKNPAAFQRADGSFKPFSSVKEEVGRFVYAPLLKSIEDTRFGQAGEHKEQNTPLDSLFYVQNRLVKSMEDAKLRMKETSETSSLMQNPLIEQWRVQVKTGSSLDAVRKKARVQSEHNLALDARRTLMLDLLKQIREKQAIDLENHDLIR